MHFNSKLEKLTIIITLIHRNSGVNFGILIICNLYKSNINLVSILYKLNFYPECYLTKLYTYNVLPLILIRVLSGSRSSR